MWDLGKCAGLDPGDLDASQVVNECGWENHFAFQCFFFPTLIMDVRVLTSIRKLFEAYDHHVKARYIFFPLNVFYWSSLS